MSNIIGPTGTSVPMVQTPSIAPAEEPKSGGAGDAAKPQGSLAAPNLETNMAGAQKQGKESSSVNNLKGDLQKQDLNGKLGKNSPAAEKPKTKEAEKPVDPIQAYKRAIVESRTHKMILEALEDQLKKAPDSQKPKIQKAIDMEKANLMDADRRREIYKKPAMEEQRRLDKLLKDMDDVIKHGPISNIRG